MEASRTFRVPVTIWLRVRRVPFTGVGRLQATRRYTPFTVGAKSPTRSSDEKICAEPTEDNGLRRLDPASTRRERVVVTAKRPRRVRGWGCRPRGRHRAIDATTRQPWTQDAVPGCGVLSLGLKEGT